MNRFADDTPIVVTIRSTRGALTALAENPALLHPEGDAGNHFVNAVHRGVRDLREAMATNAEETT